MSHSRDRAGIGVHAADLWPAPPTAAAAEGPQGARVSSAGLATAQHLRGAVESAGHTVHVLFGNAREALIAATDLPRVTRPPWC